MLVHSYKIFVMKPDETIKEMFTRFTNIVNSLKGLGKAYVKGNLIEQILRSLSRLCRQNRTLFNI